MKKMIMILVMICLVFSGSSQAALVVDIPHILESIHNGYQMYQQVMNTIKQIEYQYEQTKAQLQQLQNFDISSIDSFTDAVSFVDRNLTFMRNTENNLKNFRVNIGDGSYDLLSLYKIPGGIFDEQVDLWTTEMSEEEKARAWSHYGLDPRNYAYTQVWKGRITDGAQKLASLAGSVETQMEENDRAVEQITGQLQNTESTNGLLQANGLLLTQLYKQLSMMSYSLNTMGGLMGDMAMQTQNIPPTIHVSDDMFNTLPIPDLRIRGYK